MRFRVVIVAILALLALSAPAAADKRVALVMGNGAYQKVPALENPPNDAKAIAAALGRLGFDVELGVDVDLAAMRRTVRDFARKLQGADVALFFYAGHGMQVSGQNYLLPVDAALKTEADLDFAAMPARLVLDQMDRFAGVKIVILDACRDDPFEAALTRSIGQTRAVQVLGRGLAPIDATGGTLLAYATDPGNVAQDGAGKHSPFTAALLANIETPAVEINTMMARVRGDVYAATDKQQRPWTETSLIGEFYLSPAKPKPAPVTEAMAAPPRAGPAPPRMQDLDPRRIELALWESVQKGGTARDYEEYLRQYPNGIFANLARYRLASLQAAETAPPTDPAPETGESAAPEPPASQPRHEVPEQATAPEPETAEPEPAEVAARAEAALGLDGADRREVQARLEVSGHDPNGIDGIFGPGTRAALAAWQSEQGLPETGYLDTAALDLLKQRTETGYADWLERERAAEEARRAAAERPRIAEREAARSAPATAPAAPSGVTPAPATSAPAPSAPARTETAEAEQKIGRGYEEVCGFYFVGKPQLERRCKIEKIEGPRIGRRH